MRQANRQSHKTLGSMRHRDCRSWGAEIAAQRLSRFKVGYAAKLFDRRVECLRWYGPFCLVCASHGGDVKLWRFLRGSAESIVVGKGKGGGIMDMAIRQQTLYTVGHDGCIKRTNIELGLTQASFSTTALGSETRPGFECDHWFRDDDLGWCWQ